MIIVDTNVLSEMIRPEPAMPVVRWLRFTPANHLYTTAISEAEMRFGVEKFGVGRRRLALESAVERIFAVRFAGRILPFDSDAAKAFTPFAIAMRREGLSYSRLDAQIIAVAKAHNAAIATRDAGFAHSGVPLIDPWNS
ncbi:MAG: type II toxin-antitoxin system VapC family toxin [Rhizomicrobium sp.]